MDEAARIARLQQGGGEVRIAVLAAMVDGDFEDGGWEEAIEMEAGWGDDFEDEGAFEDNGFAGPRFPAGEGGVAGGAGEEVIDRAEEERVVGGEQGEVFAGEGGGAVEGAGEPFFGQVGEGFALALAAVEVIAAIGKVGDIEAEEVEETDDEFLEAAVLIGGVDGVSQAGGRFRGGGAEFQQQVVAAGQGRATASFSSALRRRKGGSCAASSMRSSSGRSVSARAAAPLSGAVKASSPSCSQRACRADRLPTP